MSNLPFESQTFDGYRLLRFLGRGGFGEVWLCRSEAMGDYRALKWIPNTSPDRLEKEYQSLLHYRTAAAKLRSPHLLPIEHVNRNQDGLYYVMPLADGLTNADPTDADWQPLCLAAKIRSQESQTQWFSSHEIIESIGPILQALQTLSDAGLVHRDVKPENILFFNGQPCLGDISLLGADASEITRRGTPGYSTPSWYLGGHPDMFGAAATLYSLLTGNFPDKMGRSAFLCPPQGEAAQSESERTEWKRLHGIVRRATEEKISERFVDFSAMLACLRKQKEAQPKLPKILISVLTIAGIAGATVVAAFRGKLHGSIPQAQPPANSSHAASPPSTTPPMPELSPAERAEYVASVGIIQAYLDEGKYEHVLVSVDDLLANYPQARSQPSYSIVRAVALNCLQRNDEARLELKKDIHLSTDLSSMRSRKELWESLGDLEEAEKDLTRIIDKFGPSIFPLIMRADVRAQRGNFAGVQADRHAAWAFKPEELEQRSVVEQLWKPLETKYPGYAAYLASHANTENDHAGKSIPEEDDAWIRENLISITADVASPDANRSVEANRELAQLAKTMQEGFQTHEYEKALQALERSWVLDPTLTKSPVSSLFRSLLLQRSGNRDASALERIKLCHQETNTKQIDARICLLSALDRKREAKELLDRIIKATPATDPKRAQKNLPLLKLRDKMIAMLK